MANIIEYFGRSSRGHKCGYCKTTSTSDNTYGMWTHSLSAQVYQDLIDRNWRRSGKYCYRPINDGICCPMYTIKCDALNFNLRKSHKKVIKNFNNFVKFDSRTSSSKKSKEKANDNSLMYENSIATMQSFCRVDDAKLDTSSNLATENNVSNQLKECSSNTLPAEKKIVDFSDDLKRKPNMNKKKFLRRQRLTQKVMKRQKCSESEAKQLLFERSLQKQKIKSLEDFLSEYDNPSVKHVFKKKIIPLNPKSGREAFEASFKVFRNYQKNIHHQKDNEISYRGFKSFLIDSPIKYQPNGIEPQEQADSDIVRVYGSFHQHYYIDDRLIAVAVLDILPDCISSVYLFYDSEFDFLNLGIYSALSEIALVRKLNKFLPNLKYYYMGFYIHSCPKMAYKSQFSPSSLLCSETFRWYDIESCRKKLSVQKYARFCDDPNVTDEDGTNIEDECIIVLCDSMPFNLTRLQEKYSLDPEARDFIREYAKLVGKLCCPQLLYYHSS